MKISLNWIKEYYCCDDDLPNINIVQLIQEKLTSRGFVIEQIDQINPFVKELKIAQIIKKEKHPNNDELNLLTVKYIENNTECIKCVVCGDENMQLDDKAILIQIDQILPSTGKKLKSRLIAGIGSDGMLCSNQELALPFAEHDGVRKIFGELNQTVEQALYPNGAIFDIEITYNRGDLLSAYGLARELVCIDNALKINSQLTTAQLIMDDFLHNDQVEIQTEYCSFFSLSYYKYQEHTNQDIQKALSYLSDIDTLTNLLPVDISNFIMYDVGQPTHVFDADKIVGKVTVRLSKQDEEFTDLHNIDYKLPAGLLVICDEKGIISIAGLIGGARTAYSKATLNIAIESACFDKDIILKASVALKLNTQASKIFTHGTDPQAVKMALYAFERMLMIQCIKRVAAGSINHEVQSIQMNEQQANILCLNLFQKEEFISSLACLGFEHQEDLTFTIPTWRNDIDCYQVLIGEFLRLKGYEHLKNNMPLEAANGVAYISTKLNQISNFLSNEFHECKTLALVKQNNNNSNKLDNPMPGFDCLRNNLYQSLLSKAIDNYKKNRIYAGLFEIGNVFINNEKQQQLCVILKHEEKRTTWNKLNFDLHYVQKVLIQICLMLKIDADKLVYENIEHDDFNQGHCAKIYYKKTLLGIIGTLKHELKSNVNFACIELNFTLCAAQKEKKAAAYVNYPNIYARDFSFQLNETQTASDIINKLQKSFSGIDFEIFDVYPNNYLQKRNIGVRAFIASQDTKTTQELQDICEQINKINNE